MCNADDDINSVIFIYLIWILKIGQMDNIVN